MIDDFEISNQYSHDLMMGTIILSETKKNENRIYFFLFVLFAGLVLDRRSVISWFLLPSPAPVSRQPVYNIIVFIIYTYIYHVTPLRVRTAVLNDCGIRVRSAFNVERRVFVFVPREKKISLHI